MAQPSIPPTPTRSGFAQSDGLNIAFQLYATQADATDSHAAENLPSQVPLMLVHGWGADAKSNWLDSGWIAALQPQHRVITIDVRGHGKSDKPHALDPFSYAGMSRDVLAVMDTLGVQQCSLLGYSMGAFMGAYLLGHHASRFRSMVLGGIGDETAVSAAQGATIAAALRATDIAKIASTYGKQVRQYIATNPNNDLESLAYSALKMWPQGYPLKVAGTGISSAHLPVLIVNGTNDHPYVDSADSFAAALPNGRHLRIPDTDHMSAVADQRFIKAALKFFNLGHQD